MTSDSVLDLALSFTLRPTIEGGYVNNPKDSGGATNHGITQATYTNWLTEHSMPGADIRQISAQEVRAIYKELFWEKPHFDLVASVLPASVIATFDWYLNGGAKMELAAITSFQRRINVIADGAIGPNTAKAAQNIHNDLVLSLQLCQDRQAYDDIHTGASFIHGITNRINALREFLQQNFSNSPADAIT